MATIESRPLPPPGYSATTITEADRAEIMGQANDVIDHYLNGSGSFTIDGIRKPLSDDPGYDSTVQDLNNFKNSVINARQFADDRGHILNSVVELIERTIKQLQQAAVAGNVGVTDNITLPAPATPDLINRAHVPIPLGPTDPSPRTPGGELLGPINESFSPGSATSSQRPYEIRSLAVPLPANPGSGVGSDRFSSAANSSRSFNDHLGNRGSAPLDTFDSPRSPLLRELIRRRNSGVPDESAQSNTAFEMPSSTFGRLLVDVAHRAANGLPPSAQAESPPLAPSAYADGPPGLLGGIFSSPRQAAKPVQIDPRDIRVLSSRLNIPGRNPLQPDISDQTSLLSSQLLGGDGNEPTSKYPMSPKIFGLPDRPARSGDNMDEWLARWMPLLRSGG